MQFKRWFASVIALVIALGPVSGGTQANSASDSIAAAPKVSHPLPFKRGETLSYEVSFSKFIIGGTIGQITMAVGKASTDSTKMIELKAEAVSKGFFSKLFGLKVRDRFTALVDPVDFGLNSSLKLIEEGKVRREQKAVIDRDAGLVTFTDRDLNNRSAEPKIKEKPSPTWIQDALSACYYVRTRELIEGSVIPVPITDGGETYNIEIVVGGREELKVDAGRFKTVKLDARIFDGRFIRRSGQMDLWVTDDARRIPVKAKVKTGGTTVTIELKKLKDA